MMKKNKAYKSKYAYGGKATAKTKMNMGGPVSTKGSQPQYGKTMKDAMPKTYEC
jgi:hypothetical protein